MNGAPRGRSGSGARDAARPRLFLFDDAAADGWEPFALTRPCGELRYGALLLRERLERFACCPASGAITRPWLAAFVEPGAPPVVPHPAAPEPHPRLFLCARAVPEGRTRLPARPERPLTLRVGGEVAGCLVPAGAPPPPAAWFARPAPLPGTDEIELEGEMPPAPWALVAGNATRLERDLVAGARRGVDAAARLPRGAHRIGRAPLRLAADVRIEPGVLFDARDGPIRLDEGTEVRFGARLAGPLHAGPRSRLLGGPISRLSAGARSHLRGEVEECIVLGHANKAHDGFLGHSLVGRWANLGAGTTNSDLKNNYGPVRLGGAHGEVETGLLKLGCLIGDHAKTAIGTLLNTGTVIGAGASLFGEGMPPKWVPPFSWGGRAGSPVCRREAFLATAAVVMGRREAPFDDATRGWLSAVWEAATRGAAGDPGAGLVGRRAPDPR